MLVEVLVMRFSALNRSSVPIKAVDAAATSPVLLLQVGHESVTETGELVALRL